MKIWRDSEIDKSIIKKFINDNDLITYDELNNLPYNTLISIIEDKPEDIQTLKLDNKDDKSLTFRVSMKKGSKWSKHKHDCKETIVLYKGKLFDNVTSTSLNRGGYLFVPAYKLYSFEALEDSTFYVEFEKPIN